MSPNFMNLAAAWKEFSATVLDDNPDLTEYEIRLLRIGFHAGASASLRAEQNIVAMHGETEAALILLQALNREACDFSPLASELAELDAAGV